MNLNFSYTGNAEKYGVEIRLPASIFKDRNGNNIGETIVPLVKYPEIPTTGAKFNYEIDPKTNEIIIRNTEKVEGNFYLILDIKYNVQLSEVKMDQVTVAGETVYRQTNDFTATMKVAGDDQAYESNRLSIDYRTQVTLNSLSKTRYAVYHTWPHGTNDKPADADDYFYITWKLSASTLNDDTMPYSIQILEDNPPGGQYGEMYAYSYSYGGGFQFGTLEDFKALFNPYKKPITKPLLTTSADNTYWEPYVYYRYPKSILENGKTTVHNQVKADALGVDGMVSSKATAVSYECIQPTPRPSPTPVPAATAPPDTHSANKYNTGTSYAILNRLEDTNKPQKLVNKYPAETQLQGNFYFYSSVYGWYLSKEGDQYGVKDYTSVTTDDRLVFSVAVS
ncbi:MAG TPA: hypothetical protein GX006_03880 [Clostridiales bacterium]|nr:hypothetical protein [Clostridiales bacterium]